MTERQCGSCGRTFQAASPRARFCGNTCRSRAHRAHGGRQPTDATGSPSARDNVRSLPSASAAAAVGLVGNLELELRTAGRYDTWQGQGALELARRIEEGRDTGSAIASLHRELRTATAEALKGVGASESAVTRRRNELAERRARRAQA